MLRTYQHLCNFYIRNWALHTGCVDTFLISILTKSHNSGSSSSLTCKYWNFRDTPICAFHIPHKYHTNKCSIYFLDLLPASSHDNDLRILIVAIALQVRATAMLILLIEGIYKLWHLVVSWWHNPVPWNSGVRFNNISLYEGFSKLMIILVE